VPQSTPNQPQRRLETRTHDSRGRAFQILFLPRPHPSLGTILEFVLIIFELAPYLVSCLTDGVVEIFFFYNRTQVVPRNGNLKLCAKVRALGMMFG